MNHVKNGKELNKEFSSLSNKLERIVVNGFVCRTNIKNEAILEYSDSECLSYEDDLWTANKKSEDIVRELPVVQCPKSFILKVYPTVMDIYKSTGLIIVHENNGNILDWTKPNLSKEMLHTAKLVRDIDFENCIIKKEE